MTTRIKNLLHKIHDLEHELEDDFSERRRYWRYELKANRVKFEEGVRKHHRRVKQNILRYIRESSVRNSLTAPLIYSVFLPMAILDAWFTVYQRICFPIYGIPLVRRRRYFAIDRHHLSYLNGIEKLNCVYCGYANGLVAYAREIAGRTEQYWCPIKHSAHILNSHRRYHLFVDYGDAQGYHDELPRLREALDDSNDEHSA